MFASCKCDSYFLLLSTLVCFAQMLEYVGRGNSIIDVGLAQARRPLDTRNHYFEIEIVHPGTNCYIAIGLARKVGSMVKRGREAETLN